MKLMCSSSIKMIFSQTSVWSPGVWQLIQALHHFRLPPPPCMGALSFMNLQKRKKKRLKYTMNKVIFLCCGIIRGIFGMSFFTINLKILYVSTKHSQPHSSHKQSPELSLSYFNAGRSHIGAMWHKGFP